MSSAEPNAPAAPVQTFYRRRRQHGRGCRRRRRCPDPHAFRHREVGCGAGPRSDPAAARPQFFEFWRSDNASTSAWEEANLQSIRRAVELRVTSEAEGRGPEAGGAYSLPPTASRLCVACTVSVQRLSLWQNEAAGSSEGLPGSLEQRRPPCSGWKRARSNDGAWPGSTWAKTGTWPPESSPAWSKGSNAGIDD